ncbi:MAG: ABC transporter ATP-binding protein [Spirochaetales bacterium]|nr:ABC transporter ATP-binding protein [Spirochaetales bacterium]
MENNRLLSAENIIMSFGGLKALNDVSISLKDNEILGLIGPNGSGKTTFFNVVTGIYAPTEGNIFFLDSDIAGSSPQDVARRGVLRTFQTSRLWLELSILDNLLLGMWMREKPNSLTAILRYRKVKEDFRVKAAEALEYMAVFSEELAGSPYRQVKELALVDRRRVEICRALLARPRLLLLDEPAAGMDPSETRELMRDIRKMQEKAKSLGVIIIEHDMDVISDIAERVVVFNFGRKIAEGTFGEIRKNKEVREAYLGKEYADA